MSREKLGGHDGDGSPSLAGSSSSTGKPLLGQSGASAQ